MVEPVLVAALFILGAAVGSFLNVLVLRFNTDMGASQGRSRCPDCRHQLAWYDLVPVLSFIWQQGRCRYCRHSISVQYPVVETLGGLLLLIIFWPLPASAAALLGGSLQFIIICLLLVLFLIDLRTFLLPDYYIVLLSVVVLWRQTTWPLPPMSVYWGVVATAGFLLLLWVGTKGQGLGLGDVKLMVPLGLLFGVGGAIFLLFAAFVVGGAVGAYLLLTGKATPKTAVPFGPYLAGMAIALLIWPQLPPVFWQFIFGA